MRIIGSLLLFLVVSGCGYKSGEEKTIQNVVRVFMHEYKHYSVFVREPGTSELKQITLNPEIRGTVRIFADVPEGQNMWVYTHSFSGGIDIEVGVDIDIHVHSEKNIEGAVWDHGKLGRGNTHIIE